MIYKFKVQWGRLLAVAIATLFISLGLPNWKIFQTQALDVPENNLIAQNVSVLWNKGSFPVENFQSYTSGFGYRISPVTGERQFHNGLDLAAPRGSYIRNWWSGKVVEVSDDTACGTMISIQSGAWEHFYCHMEGYVQGSSLIDREGGLQIALGQNIPAGARIGRIGMSGRTTGPHLHWGLKHNGGYIDPALVLKEMFKRQTISSTS
ncbi:MAG: M23 family metallopeptidase [Waterburya sp.]